MALRRKSPDPHLPPVRASRFPRRSRGLISSDTPPPFCDNLPHPPSAPRTLPPAMQPRRISLLSFLVAVPTLAAADWDRFRGPGGLGTAGDTTIPVSFGPKDALWKTPIPGHVNSSPIVSKGKIFLQTASDDGS